VAQHFFEYYGLSYSVKCLSAMTSLERTEQSRVRDLVDAGTEVTGSAAASVAGVGIGYALGGPTGAAAGAAFRAVAGPTARIMLQDMAHGALDFTYRMLGQREKVRVGAVVVYCYDKFRDNIDNGMQPWQDGFLMMRLVSGPRTRRFSKAF
jgi:hypothetical protein